MCTCFVIMNTQHAKIVQSLTKCTATEVGGRSFLCDAVKLDSINLKHTRKDSARIEMGFLHRS